MAHLQGKRPVLVVFWSTWRFLLPKSNVVVNFLDNEYGWLNFLKSNSGGMASAFLGFFYSFVIPLVTHGFNL